MVDESFDREQRQSRTEINAAIDSGLGRIAGAVMAAFDALHRISWQAPWATSRTRSN